MQSVSGSRSGAPRPLGAPWLRSLRGPARPSPSRCPAEIFGLQRLWQDGGCRAEKLLSNCAAQPGPHQVPRAAHPVPRRIHPQRRASSLTPTACAAPSPPQSPALRHAHHRCQAQSCCCTHRHPPTRVLTHSPTPSPVVAPSLTLRCAHGSIPVKQPGCAAAIP